MSVTVKITKVSEAGSTGSIANSGLAKLAKLVVSGSATPLSTVAVFDLGTKIGQATADKFGAWSFSTKALANKAQHDFTAQATNQGETSDASNNYYVTVDTTTGAVAAPSILKITNTTGKTTFIDGASTNQRVVKLSGIATPNSSVTVFDNKTQIGQAVKADAKGVWSLTASSLKDAAHSFTATVKVGTKTSVSSSDYVVKVDTKAPVAPSITAVTDNLEPVVGTIAKGKSTNDTTPVLTGKAEANSTVKIFDGTKVLGTTVTDNSGAWSFNSSELSEGTHKLSATATDVAGNPSKSGSAYTIVVDTTSPDAPVISAVNETATDGTVGDLVSKNDITVDQTVKLTGTAEAGSSVAIMDGNTQIGTATANQSGDWTFVTDSLADKMTHAFSAQATDAAGNVSEGSDSYAITIDTNPTASLPPVITAIIDDVGGKVTVADGGATNDPKLTINGTGKAGNIVTVYGNDAKLGTATVSKNGTWTFATTKLADDDYSFTATIKAKATSAESAESAAYAVTVDTKIDAPTVEGVSQNANTDPVASGGAVGVANPLIMGTAEPNSTVQVFDGTTLLGTVNADVSGAWDFTSTGLTEGTHSFSAKATDVAGNVSKASDSFSVAVNLANPDLTEADVEVNQTANVATVTIDPNGQTFIGVTVDFSMFGGDSAVEATPNGDGLYVATSNVKLPSWPVGTTTVTPLDPDVAVTVTNGFGSTTVDNIPPVLTDSQIKTTAANGKVSVVVTGTDYFGDTMDKVLVDFSAFGGASNVKASFDGNAYSASISAATDNIEGKFVTVTALDVVGNQSSFIDDTGLLV